MYIEVCLVFSRFMFLRQIVKDFGTFTASFLSSFTKEQQDDTARLGGERNGRVRENFPQDTELGVTSDFLQHWNFRTWRSTLESALLTFHAALNYWIKTNEWKKIPGPLSISRLLPVLPSHKNKQNPDIKVIGISSI